MITSEVPIGGTLIWYYAICKREVWLMSHQLSPDQDVEQLAQGREIHEEYYSRNRKELDIENSKIDMIQKKDGSLLISEIKKSSKYVDAVILQLKYYLSIFHEKGVEASGVIRIPTEKKQIEVNLTPEDILHLEKVKSEIIDILCKDLPPELVRVKYCKSCAYSEFCWS